MDTKLTEVDNKINSFFEQYVHYQNQNLEEISKIKQNFFKEIEIIEAKINAVSDNTGVEIGRFKIKLDNELEKIHREIELINNNTEQLYKQYLGSMKEINNLKSLLKDEINSTNERISVLDGTMEDLFDAQKKNIFYKILPLYLAFAVLIGWAIKNI